MDIGGRGHFLFPLDWPGWLGSLGKLGPGLLARAQEGTLPVTLLREGIETPGDPNDAGVEAASSGEAVITADAREAAVHPVVGVQARALAGTCREAQVSQSPPHDTRPRPSQCIQDAPSALLQPCKGCLISLVFEPRSVLQRN